jgi:short-subunit dehydrogenase
MNPPTLDLTGRRVLITGASRGLGRDLVRGFAAVGALPALVARDAAALDNLVTIHGGQAYPTDLTDREAVRGLLDRVEADGPVDILINNAGDERVGPFAGLDADTLEFVVQLNALATAELCRQAVPRMLDRGVGRLVNISSLGALVCTPHLAAYSATKAFVSHLSAGLSLELRDTPVTCTKVEIGETTGTGQAHSVRRDPVVTAAFDRLYRLHLSRPLTVREVTDATIRAVREGRPSVQLPRRVAPAARLTDLIRASTWYLTRAAIPPA